MKYYKISLTYGLNGKIRTMPETALTKTAALQIADRKMNVIRHFFNKNGCFDLPRLRGFSYADINKKLAYSFATRSEYGAGRIAGVIIEYINEDMLYNYLGTNK